MNELLLGHDREVSTWVGAHLRRVGASGFGPCTAIGVVREGVLVCGVVFYEYLPEFRSIQVSLYACDPRWASRRTIRAILSYPFEQLGVNRVWALIEHKNERAQRFIRGLGFVKEGVGRYAFGDQHAVSYSMLAKEYRRMFERKSHGQEKLVAARCA